MAILTKAEAKSILEKLMSYSKAEECEVDLDGSVGGNIRYALNTVTTSGAEDNADIVVQASFGKKSGIATINEFDDKSLRRVVRRAEELARLAPENPEYVSVLGPQKYIETKAWHDNTANVTPAYRARAAGHSIRPSREKDMTAAGFLADQGSFSAKMNSKGLFAYHRETSAEFTVTIRSKDGTGSGWVSRDYNDISKLDTEKISKIALEKAIRSREPKGIEPGKYTVILEPAATGDLIGRLGRAFNARPADEGRSYMSKKGGGTKLGEKIVDERISVYSDPANAAIPTAAWSGDGRPREKTYWLKDGVVQNLFYSRYWAEKQNVAATPFPANVIFSGGDASLDDMIKDTKKGILVTRLWYIRAVDRQTLLFTGLTRDGTFYIENGEVKFPIKNMRFNESPIIMLNNVEALGKPQRYDGDLYPAMKIRDFTFTSLSDAV